MQVYLPRISKVPPLVRARGRMRAPWALPRVSEPCNSVFKRNGKQHEGLFGRHPESEEKMCAKINRNAIL